MPKKQKNTSGVLTPVQLRRVVSKYLPGWFSACAAEADAIVLHEAAFGTSEVELFLFACAIKYAASEGKTIHVTCGRAISSDADRRLPADFSIEGLYRDQEGKGILA